MLRALLLLLVGFFPLLAGASGNEVPANEVPRYRCTLNSIWAESNGPAPACSAVLGMQAKTQPGGYQQVSHLTYTLNGCTVSPDPPYAGSCSYNVHTECRYTSDGSSCGSFTSSGAMPVSRVSSVSCPTNSTPSTGSMCACDAGYKPDPGGLAMCVSTCDKLKKVSEGYYDIGLNPQGDPKLVACAGHCQVVFDGYSPSASALVDGTKHWFSKGMYVTTGATCTAAKQETSQIGSASADKPEDKCPEGQGVVRINDKVLCVRSGSDGEEEEPPDPVDKSSKTVERSTVTNPDGSVTVTEVTTETDKDGNKTVTTTRTTTRPDGSQKVETEKTGYTPGGTPTGSPDGELPEVKMCGRPGEPACKIDETGTPDAATAPLRYSHAGDSVDAAVDAAIGQIQGASTSRSSLPWTPTAILVPPGSCSSLSTETRLGTLLFNLCDSQLAALWRTLLSWLVGMFTLLYGWRSATAALK